MTMLEDSLRNMFASRVESQPPARDPASAAIGRGRAIRRWHTAGSTVAAAMVLVLTVGGVTSLNGWWRLENGTSGPAISFDIGPATPPPVASPAGDTGIGLDLRVGNRLWTMDGRQLRLDGVGEVTQTYRVPDGWVYSGESSVRFLRTDGTSVSLSGEDGRWVLSPDGDRIAFVVDEMLYVAQLKPSGLAVRSSVAVPAATSPVALLDDQVIIHVGSEGFDLLDPVRGYVPVQNPDVTAIYGVRGDSIAALVRWDGEPGACLADLRPTADGLRVGRTGGCDLDLRPDAPADRLAPGGGWLAERRASEVALVDVERALGGEEAVLDCPASSSVPPAWADAKTILTADARGLVRCRTDGTQQVLRLPDGVGGGWQLVPRLMAPSPVEPAGAGETPSPGDGSDRGAGSDRGDVPDPGDASVHVVTPRAEAT